MSMLDIKLKSNQITIILSCIVVVGFILRILGYEHITFGYDQARDALEAMSIFTTDHIKIIGPQTDIPGLFHGPLYWYLIAPFYYLNEGDPYAAKLLLIILNLACIPILYKIVQWMTDNTLIALMTAGLFAISSEAVQYARWMSNPSPALLTTLLSWYAFYLMYKKDWRGIALFLLSWPFSVQFEFFLVYHLFIFIPLFVWKFSTKQLIRAHLRNLLMVSAFCLIVLSPFVIAQVKFGFQSVRALTDFLTHAGSSSSYSRNPIDFILILAQSFQLNIINIPTLLAIGVLIGICLSYFFVNETYRQVYVFCLVWFISPLIIFLLGHHTSHFLTIGNIPPLLILVSILFVSCISRKNKLLKVFGGVIFIVILTTSIYRIYEIRNKQEFLFSVQENNDIYDRIELAAWTYTQSAGEPFAINTVTVPLFVNTTWSYIYNQYSRKVVLQMPAWKGADQKGRYGGEISYTELSPQTGKALYLIFEPSGGIPLEYYNNYSAFEDRRSRIITVKKFGAYTVQKRVFINEMGFDYNHMINFALSGGKSVTK